MKHAVDVLRTVLALLIVGAAPLAAQAGDDESDRATLRGVDSVAVRVVVLGGPSDINVVALRSRLATRLELALRSQGIRVRASDAAQGEVLFGLTIVAGRNRGGEGDVIAYAFDYALKFNQFVQVLTNSEIAFVTTWERGFSGIHGTIGFESHIVSSLDALIDSFLNAFLTANPRAR